MTNLEKLKADAGELANILETTDYDCPVTLDPEFSRQQGRMLRSLIAALDQLQQERDEALKDAERYRWIRKNYEWRRHAAFYMEESHAFIGCRFPYSMDFSCAAMLDHNIDRSALKSKEAK